MANIDKIQVGSTTYDIAASASATNTFTSSDVADGSATAWTTVAALASGETTSSILGKVSQMFKNIRFLYKKLGTTDISSAGTDVTTAISNIYTKTNAISGVYPVVGTQTAATGTWTGVINAPALYDGMIIAYYLPFAGSGSATLNLTLSGGGTTGAINCYYQGNTRLTTHFGAGSTILLTYWSAGAIKVGATATTDNRWTADTSYNTNTTYAVATTAANGLLSAADKIKLDSVAASANNYTHPTYTSYASALRKFTTDTSGHVSATAAVAKSDITGLGIPAQDTTYAAFTSAATGLVPAASSGTTNYATTGYVLTGAGWKAGTKYNTDSNTTYGTATTGADGLMTSAMVTKLNGIATSANAYTHPTYTSAASGLYKVAVDGTGHVSGATAVAKSDITGLGIPAQDTTYTFTDGAPTLAWGTTSTVGTVGGVALTVTMPANPDTNTTYAFSNGNPTLAWGTKSTVGTAGGVEFTVTMPANPNTNTTYGTNVGCYGTLSGTTLTLNTRNFRV